MSTISTGIEVNGTGPQSWGEPAVYDASSGDDTENPARSSSV